MLHNLYVEQNSHLLNPGDSCSDGICNVICAFIFSRSFGAFHFHDQGVGIASFVVFAAGALNVIPATGIMEQAWRGPHTRGAKSPKQQQNLSYVGGNFLRATIMMHFFSPPQKNACLYLLIDASLSAKAYADFQLVSQIHSDSSRD